MRSVFTRSGRRGGLARARALSSERRSEIARRAAQGRWRQGALAFADDGKLASFCQKWHVSQIEIFGSASRGELEVGSDVDVLLSFADDTKSIDILTYDSMRRELEGVFGRSVDLFMRAAVERWANQPLRRRILEEAKVIHAAA